MHTRLRRVNKTEQHWQQFALIWRRQGYALEREIVPDPEARLFFFRADSGWQGCIDLDEWLARVMPDSAKLARAAWQYAELALLFTQSVRPLDQLPDELAYHSLSTCEVSEKNENLTLSIQTSQGRVWLIKLPEKRSPAQSAGEISIDNVPLTVHFNIGHSAISLSLLKQITPGDVIFINEQFNTLTVEQQKIGSFYKTEEGFMYENMNEDVDAELEDSDWDIQDDEEEEPALIPRDNVKVKINFVLQQSRLSLSEIERFCQGMVLPCKPDAESNVIITANGAAIARGEIVWLEDRPGVEILEIYPGAKKDVQ